ncbi:molybdopterin oxidoreductase family protein [Nocardia asteroides NBRC 15531]|uniref:Oxidoreductase n=1 Tax=Nocardia asteroides NBRC 15531 TaxID=1110697 RepID=U5EEP1_NOCAS|nr:molybdopterin-dependent oxidoreductase [Nocardia asteroides]TLF68908.1 molybdopterin oxidoreductase family protein [Nocardia asteroides NBRC 15531]UGT48376.1 molybdopterin-dependent oxidoreductase [Nocardia asteroides]SFL57475.1 Anaerobic selenocysteine-containing dehydrogenase [Nocardia asteroides]VEG32403.1 Sulfur reductase chain A [Nocardia asteroides]GAD84871.1 putative oxidoreductase [Nocardia asteroides NBRC 15531]
MAPRTLLRTCPLCEAVCGLTITLDDADRVLSVRGDRDDPFSKGFLCPKGASFGKLDEDPDLVTTPLIREGTEFRAASWDEAFDLIATRFAEVTATHGSGATGIYLGNPNAHTVAGALYLPALIRALSTRHIYTASTADQMPKQVAAGLMFGDPLTVPVPDLDRTDFLLMLGANPLESNGSLCTAPDFPGRLKALRARGGTLVVVDPRETRTAAVADRHLYIRPGADAYLLFAIIHTLFAENLTEVRLDVDGIDTLRATAAEFTPDAVAERTGIPADTIRGLARDLAAAPTAAVYARIGTCTAEFGTITQWLVDAINALTGNLDAPGGAMFATAAAGGIPRSRPFRPGRWTSRVRGLPEAMGELPVATLADEIETPGDGQIRALVTVAGNPVLSAPSGARLDRGLAELDFMVSVDRYVNETTRHASVILPPPRSVQSPHYDFALLQFAVRNYARYSPPLVPLDGRPSESAVLARLAAAVSGQPHDGEGAASPIAVVDELVIAGMLHKAGMSERRDELEGADTTEQRIDLMLKLGPYGAWNGGELSLRTLLDNPHGLDLGPLRPRLPGALRTASGKVDLAPAQLVDDVARLRAGLTASAPEMVLIGRRQLRSNNSWMHNIAGLVGGSNRCTLQIHPDDATRLGLGEQAKISSAAGSLTVQVEQTPTIMPGVVSLPHGWGHSASTSQSVASATPGVNANVLTDDSVVDAISGTAVFNGVPVTVGPA